MNFFSTNKFKLIQSEIDAIPTISQDDKDKVYSVLKNHLKYDESKSDYHLYAYQVQKEKLNNDPILKEAYLVKQREKNKKYMSNEENKEKKKLYNKEYRLRKKREAVENNAVIQNQSL